jgi:hypothetical protein
MDGVSLALIAVLTVSSYLADAVSAAVQSNLPQSPRVEANPTNCENPHCYS